MQFPQLKFDLGEDLDMLRDSIAAFAANEIAPRAAEIDRNNEFPMDLWKKMGDLGILGITVPEEYGGAGMGIWRTSWRWKRSAAPAVRSGCPTARTRTFA